MEDVVWILHVSEGLKRINRMFCSVYKYCDASAETSPSGKLSPPCCYSCLQKEEDFVLHFINRRCEARCGADSADVPHSVSEPIQKALKSYVWCILFFSMLLESMIVEGF